MKITAFSLIIGIILMNSTGNLKARDPDGRYANAPLKQWFDQLASGYGRCCSIADGQIVAGLPLESGPP